MPVSEAAQLPPYRVCKLFWHGKAKICRGGRHPSLNKVKKNHVTKLTKFDSAALFLEIRVP